jgi:hypothetical protein
VLGQIGVEQGEVLYLALEDPPRRLAKRLAILGWECCPDDGFSIVTEWRRMSQGGLRDLGRWLSLHTGCRLVIIDTLAMIRNLDENQRNVYLEEYRIGRSLKQVADAFRIAMLVLHHNRKMKADDPLESISGSFGLTGAADGALIIQRARGEADATLFVTGRDIPDERHWALRFDRTTAQWVALGDAAEYAVSKERQGVLALLKELRRAVSYREIASTIGRPVAATKMLLWRMHQDGQVRCVADGQYMALDSTSASTTHAVTAVTALPLLPELPPRPVTPVTAVTGVTPVTAVTGEPGICLDCGAALQDGWFFRCPACWDREEASLVGNSAQGN